MFHKFYISVYMKKLFLCIIWTGFCIGLLPACEKGQKEQQSDPTLEELLENRKNLEKLLEERRAVLEENRKNQANQANQAETDALQRRLEQINKNIALAEAVKRELSKLRDALDKLVIVSCVCNLYYKYSGGDVERNNFELEKVGKTEEEVRDTVLKSCEAKLKSIDGYSDAHIGDCEVKN